MKQTLTSLAVALTLSFAAHAMSAGCYVDTFAFDTPTRDFCYAYIHGAHSSTAVFAVLDIDQTTGRDSIEYLDNTCNDVFYTLDEGLVCLRTLWANTSIAQRVRVTDTYTGSSVILSATAYFENI
ncbi:hypothetical protein ACLESO_04150 [Pyxidicoccus sp. 3LG]